MCEYIPNTNVSFQFGVVLRADVDELLARSLSEVSIEETVASFKPHLRLTVALLNC